MKTLYALQILANNQPKETWYVVQTKAKAYLVCLTDGNEPVDLDNIDDYGDYDNLAAAIDRAKEKAYEHIDFYMNEEKVHVTIKTLF